jgi:hypothetical protein
MRLDAVPAEWTSLLDLAPDGAILGYASFVEGESFGFVYREGTFEDLPPEIQPLASTRPASSSATRTTPPWVGGLRTYRKR